ncbi:MAG: iron-sulfur cluster assembly protein, partial [Pseudomonadota bacterium]
MSVTREAVVEVLKTIADPESGSDLISADVVRALSVDDGAIRFVIEAKDGAAMEPARSEAEAKLKALPGVARVTAVTTAHSDAPAPAKPPPDLRIGG